ncbi:MAG: TetR/AcrR family transcriptional regulator [Alteraurantiacibacter sp.]
MAKSNVDLARRAEIGAGRRTRTRARLLDAARTLYGREGGRATRIEDICEQADIARGTFYNHFTGLDALQAALFEEISLRFDQAVHVAFEAFGTPAERTSAAVRYYLTHMLDDREWGWCMVNTGMGIGFFHDTVVERVSETIQQGIDAGQFTIATAEAGRDILLGAGLASASSLLAGEVTGRHIEHVAQGVLRALGVTEEEARTILAAPLPPLRQVEPG